MRRSLWIIASSIGMIVAQLCLAVGVQAAEPILTVDPADSPLQIHGVLGGQTNSFAGTLRLTVNGGDADQLQFLASDLHHVTLADTLIDRSQVAVPPNITLRDGQPNDIRVTIHNITSPGTYTGTLQFLLPGQPLTQALAIPLQLSIHLQPRVAPVLTTQAFQVARCDWSLDCWLANLVLPGSATHDRWQIQLDNQGQESAVVTSAQAVMQGQQTAQGVTVHQVQIAPLPELPANAISTFPVSITRNALLPDHYAGTLRFTIDGLAEPVIINSTLDVRNGPLWALLAILLGIVVGRLARDMESAIAQKQVKLLPRWYELRARLDFIKNEPAHAALNQELQGARAKIESSEDTAEVATQFLANLDTKLAFLLDLQNVEEKLASLPPNAQEALLPILNQSRAALLAGQMEEAEQKRKNLIAAMHDAQSRIQNDTMMGMGDELKKAWDSLTGLLSGSTGPSLKQSREALSAATERQTNRWRRFLAGLSGLQLVTASTRFWFFRPLLSVLLLVVLTLLGLQTLYVNAGATFGVGGIYDYLGLLLWGITADIAQRTLLTLPST
jgi:hypothetical protein